MFKFVDADVEVVAGFQWQAAEDGVAVVALRVNGVFAVAAVVGEAVAEDVVMRLFGEVGAICLSIAFVPEFGFVKGVCYGIFHSVTAFCNAGFDIMGNFSSLTAYFNNPIVNISIMLLIILGGLGFSTIFDINRKRAFKKFRLNTKIILITTAILIVIPTFLFFIFEMNNPKTLGNMNLGEKILASLFNLTDRKSVV